MIKSSVRCGLCVLRIMLRIMKTRFRAYDAAAHACSRLDDRSTSEQAEKAAVICQSWRRAIA